MSVGLVVDTAGLLAYTEASIRVGEIVAVVADRGEMIVIPRPAWQPRMNGS